MEHVKAHRTKKEKENMSQFEKFVTEGNEKAHELAEAGAMLDEGFMAEARAKTMPAKMPGKCTGPKFLPKSLGKWRRRHLGGHDLVRRTDRQGQVIICARESMGSKLMNCCRPE